MALRQPGDRLRPEDLIKHTPVQMPLLAPSAWLLAAVGYLLTWLIFAVLLLSYGRWWLLGLILFIPPMVVRWPDATAATAKWFDQRWLLRTWVRQAEKVAPVGYSSKVAQAQPGMWICLRDNYRQENSEYRALEGRTAPPLLATYHLLVATLRENGNERFLSFSDGSVEIWNPRSTIFVHDEVLTSYGYRDGESVADAVPVLDTLLRKLESATSGSWPAEAFLDSLYEYYELDAIVDAMRTAEWWGLIEFGEDAEQYAITDAGRVWVESHMALQTSRRGASQVKERRSREPNFSVGTNFGIINVAHSISGNKTTIHNTPSDAELLMTLAAVLRRDDIPWNSPQLADVREEIEVALAERDPHRSGLKAAIAKLLRVCKDLAIGMSGNALFEVLKSIAS